MILPTYFNPRAPRGARLARVNADVNRELFQSTRPSRGATHPKCLSGLCQAISIHAPLAGRDQFLLISASRPCYFNPRAPRGARRRLQLFYLRKIAFQSTRPSRGATSTAQRLVGSKGFQSTRPSRGATSKQDRTIRGDLDISIHAPLAGRDRKANFSRFSLNISIHAPLAGRDDGYCRRTWLWYKFQSTRPSRGATFTVDLNGKPLLISIHAPLAGRDERHSILWSECKISIHAPLAGRDN